MSEFQPQSQDDHRTSIAAKIVLLYFLTVISLIAVVTHFDIPLDETSSANASAILRLIWFSYYAMPVILAFVFCAFFRPRAENFRNVYFAIISIQILYSFCIGMLRWDYQTSFQSAISWKKSDRIVVKQISRSQFDRNQDGFIDEIDLTLVMDFHRIRPGNYLVHGVIVPGASLSPFSIDGGGEFSIARTGDANIISKDFSIRPRQDLSEAPLAMQSFQVKYLLFRITKIDGKGKRLMSFARWAPYFRVTNWDGQDPEIFDDWQLLDSRLLADDYAMRAPVVSKDLYGKNF